MTSAYQAHPLRLQRRKGSPLHPRECWVGAGTRWDNPFETAEKFRAAMETLLGDSQHPRLLDMDIETLAHMATIARDIQQLSGFYLICDCPLDSSCHANTLAAIANTKSKHTKRHRSNHGPKRTR